MEIIKAFLGPESVHPLKGRVLMEALFPAESEGGLILSNEFERRYSSLGRVVEGEGIEPGTLAILHDDTETYDGSYYDVLCLTLNDEGKEFPLVIDAETEPHLRERWEQFRRNPSTHNKKLTAYDIEKSEHYTFLCSDIISLGPQYKAHKSWEVEYIPTFMIYLWSEGKFRLYYIAHVDSILALLGE